MNTKILVNALDPEECRIARVQDSHLEEFHIETSAREYTRGNIYKGVIARIEPSLQAVFVDYGAERHGFLQKPEIHKDYFLESKTGNHSIKNILKRGQELLVQVTKEPTSRKGALLTTFVSLPGRFIVLMPGSSNRGVSRKIESEEERNRLKDLMAKLKIPEGFGLIIRTAGTNCTKTTLTKDLQYLLRLWKTINKTCVKEKAPQLIYKERHIVIRSLRDTLTPDVKEILIDDETVYQDVKKFISIISPKQQKIIKRYDGAKPIFSKHQLEEQISSIFESRVNLPSGGSIVINQTEALVAIDVNSGKATRNTSFELTALKTNIEAAEEIARQLRLRDMGGLIVIDFIDMRETKHKKQVEKALKSAIALDKARIGIGKISKFGLLEMSRQRIRPSINFASMTTCIHCRGKGIIPSKESLGLKFLRKIRMETLKEEITQVTGFVHADIADYVLNKKRKEILDLETRRDLTINIFADNSLLPGEDRIVCE